MSSLLNMGNVSGSSFTESIAGKRLVASKTIKAVQGTRIASGYYAYYPMTGESFLHTGSGIASVKLLNQGTNNTVTIKVDGVQLTDFSHFVDYRRGHSGYMINTPTPPSTSAAAGLDNSSYPIEGIYDENDAKVGMLIKVRYTNGHQLNFTSIIEKPGSYDFLTIPFVDGFEIKINDYSYYTNTRHDNELNTYQKQYTSNFSASIAVWENDD